MSSHSTSAFLQLCRSSRRLAASLRWGDKKLEVRSGRLRVQSETVHLSALLVVDGEMEGERGGGGDSGSEQAGYV
jgi:hypothetical protein